jgi:hypothetical protein
MEKSDKIEGKEETFSCKNRKDPKYKSAYGRHLDIWIETDAQ